MQQGQVFKRNGSWYVRFYRDGIQDGAPVRRRVCEKLARYSDDYRSKKDVAPLVADILSPVNDGSQQPESSLTIADFTVAAPLFHAAGAGMPVAPYANVRGWFERVAALPCWNETAPQMSAAA